MNLVNVSLSPIDWAIIIGYCILTLAVGLSFMKIGSSSFEEYFVAGRKFTWWLAGTSMVASTFAADTPLVVTALVRNQGIQGNWFNWSWVLANILCAVVFAKFWSRAKMVTDVEIYEFRYDGAGAKGLRVFNALFYGIVRTCIVMSWVTLAMSKIASAIFDLPTIVMFKNFSFKLIPSGMEIVHAATEFGFTVNSVLCSVDEKAIIIVSCILITLIYSTLSGIWGVVVTDFIQFIMAMIGSIGLAIVVVIEVGGLGTLKEKVIATVNNTNALTGGDYAKLYPGEQMFSFTPNLSAGGLAIVTFIVMVTCKWWYDAQGSNQIAQRIFSCKNDRHGMLAMIWFAFLNNVVRYWPWIIAALASIILFPKLADPEMAYPKMVAILPEGLKGIMVASLLAAFMSTINTNMNCGASYIVNDIYKRFCVKNGTQKHYVLAGQIVSILLIIIAGIFANIQTSIFSAWVFLAEITSGMVVAILLRWLWWRINAWSEISAMISSIVLSNAFRIIGYYTEIPFFASNDWFAVRFVILLVVGTIVWLIVTFLTRPVPHEKLRKFYTKVKPFGFWKPIHKKGDYEYSKKELWSILLSFIYGVLGIFLLMFSIGKLLLLEYMSGIIMLILGIFFCCLLLRTINKDKTLAE